MPVRPTTLATLLVASILLAHPTGSRAQTVAAATVADSAAAPADPVADARSAFQTAWAQRQAGDFAGAIATAERGLGAVARALVTGSDSETRLELVELQSNLGGLRDAASKDARSASSAAAAGNDADEKVLSAPAAEEIQPQLNADVYRWIDFFTGAGRSTFERWLKRSGRYMELFRDVLHQEGLPPDLVHLVFVESGFNLNARSVSAAVGPWQLLGGTARMFGLNVNRWVDERKDPEKSSVAAARYLKHLYSVFGDWPLALASYNAGEGTVLRAIQNQGTTNYWDLKLPRQTEDYVPQFMAILAITHDPSKYGFDSVPLDDPMEFDQIALHGAVDLHAIARLAGCSYEELRELNPAVLRGQATAPGGVTTLRVPSGKGAALMQKLGGGAPLPAASITLEHRVKSGETLLGIAAEYGVSARRLALANGIGRRHPLRHGMVLTVPSSLSSPSPRIVDSSDPRASTAYVPPRDIRSLVSISGRSTADGRSKWTVRHGQTLAMIADSNHVSVDDLMSWNHLKGTMLGSGDRLKIRSEDTTSVALSPADSAQVAGLRLPARRHHGHGHAPGAAHHSVTVRAGDTLSSIANRHGVTVSQLMRVNGLKSERLRAGQRLRIPTG
ncbi:MAG: LysM peptidoglycan-binding domain-containing protein [Candidatus Eisenbacteria bacterium]|nr:LysM peptidoglycan-binding domain-containing protein [Candidatus Eisenbacteria bacterium]